VKVVWDAQALERLAEMEEFIAADSPARAQKFVERLVAGGNSLSRSPLRGRIVPELSDPQIREIFEKAYRIVSRIRTSHVEILAVFEGHRLLRGREIFSDD